MIAMALPPIRVNKDIASVLAVEFGSDRDPMAHIPSIRMTYEHGLFVPWILLQHEEGM
jgi:hypothetical protein